MNLPNAITLFRIALVPVLVVILLGFRDADPLIAFGIFVLAAVTDMADGVLARSRGEVTTLGKLLDPIADKMLVSAVLICFVDLRIVSAWIVIVIISREFTLSCFRIIAASRGVNIASSPLGKMKMWSEVITISLLLLGEPILGSWYVLARIGIWVMMAAVLISGADYIIRHGRLLLQKED